MFVSHGTHFLQFLSKTEKVKRKEEKIQMHTKPLMGSFQTFHTYLGVEAAFRADNPKNFDTGHVYVLGLES